MPIDFYKYQGTGNDFILIDNRLDTFPKNDTKLIAEMCDRKFGIGADGLILLETTEGYDFKMVYYNADGAEGSFCGNGARCITRFARFLNIIESEATFLAADGTHKSTIMGEQVSLEMTDVESISQTKNYSFLNTGSPHHVEVVEDLENYEVFESGREIRNTVYGKAGSNINFVQPLEENTFAVRTYERGVEDETMSCGTGVTAVVIAMANLGKAGGNDVGIITPGGKLRVTFKKHEGKFTNIHLIGPAKQVFKGKWG